MCFNEMNDYDFLTITEVADELGIGINSAYQLLKENRIRNFKIGKKYKVTRGALKEFIRSNTEKSTQLPTRAQRRLR